MGSETGPSFYDLLNRFWNHFGAYLESEFFPLLLARQRWRGAHSEAKQATTLPATAQRIPSSGAIAAPYSH